MADVVQPTQPQTAEVAPPAQAVAPLTAVATTDGGAGRTRAREQRKVEIAKRFSLSETEPAAAAVEAPPADAPKAAEPPKPPEVAQPSPLQRLFEQAKAIAAERRPASVPGRVPQAPAVQAEAPAPVEAVHPPIAAGAPISLLRQAELTGQRPEDILRHYISEMKSGAAAEFKTPTNPALREVETMRGRLEEMERRNSELEQQFTGRLTQYEQQMVETKQQQTILDAAHYLSQAPSRDRWKFVAASDSSTMAGRLAAMIEVAAEHPETRGLTLEQVVDKLEESIKGEVTRYESIFAPKQPPRADPKLPQAQAESQTIPPGSLSATGAPAPGNRRSDAERKRAAVDRLSR